jgi:hypothetical protein
VKLGHERLSRVAAARNPLEASVRKPDLAVAPIEAAVAGSAGEYVTGRHTGASLTEIDEGDYCATSRGNNVLFCGLGNHVGLRGLPGGAEGIAADAGQRPSLLLSGAARWITPQTLVLLWD